MSGKTLPVAESFDAILAVNDRPEETVPMPEWGCSVVVREPDAETMASISRSTQGSDGKTDAMDFMCKTILAGVVRPQVSPGHLEALRKRSHSALMRLFQAINGKKNEPSKS